MYDGRLALPKPSRGGLTLAGITAGSGFWAPLWPPTSTAKALAYLHIAGKQLTSPSGGSCCWKCSSCTCCRDPGSCYAAKRRRQLLLPTQRAGLLLLQPPGEQQAAAAASKTEPGYCCPDRQWVASVAQKPGANGIWQPGWIHYSQLTCGPFPFLPRHNAVLKHIQTARLSQTARS